MLTRILIGFFILFYTNYSLAENNINKKVDDIFNSLNKKEKLAQLFWVDARNYDDKKTLKEIENYILKNNLGGVILFKGEKSNAKKLITNLKSKSSTPIIFSIDAEWGLNMRIKKINKFPYHLTLGCLKDDSLVYFTAQSMGNELKNMGFHINFAPVLDVNSNPENPVINFRAFGDDKHNVYKKGKFFIEGLQSIGVSACAKHFPGHGNTNKDSHLLLPKITTSIKNIINIDLFPFTKLSNTYWSIMVAHLNIPALQKNNIPSSLSKNIVTKLLKNRMKYKGLVITDAMNMKGVLNFSKNSVLNDINALMAGNDVILHSINPQKTIDTLILLTKNDKNIENLVYKKVKKVIEFYIRITELQKNAPEVKVNKDSIIHKVYKNSLCRIDSTLNIKTKTRYLEIKGNYYSKKYNSIIKKNNFITNKKPNDRDIILFFGKDKYLTKEDKKNFISFFKNYSEKKNLNRLIIFGNPYYLYEVKNIIREKKELPIFIMPENNIITLKTVLNKIINGSYKYGKLPINIYD